MKDSKGLIIIFVFLLIGGGVIIASVWGESRRKELAFEVYSTIDKFKENIDKNESAFKQITKLEENVAKQQEEIKSLSEKIIQSQEEKQKTVENFVTTEQLEKIQARLDIIEKNNLSFKAKHFVSLNAVISLRQAIETNRTFETELLILKKIYPQMVEWEVLGKYAKTGLPTLSNITTSFADLMKTRHATKIKVEKEDLPFWKEWKNEIENRVKNLVHIRPTQFKAEDTTDETILARVEQALNEKNLYRATDEMARLEMSSPKIYEHFKMWYMKSVDRLLCLKVADEMVMKITASLAKTQGEK